MEPKKCYIRIHVYMGLRTLKEKGGSGWMSFFGDSKFNFVPTEFDRFFQYSRILMVRRS